MTCTADEHSTPFNNQIRGTNLGGWMVLEPWITPSMFYQFLGGNETTTAFDSYTFCKVLGPEEGNKQLRRHWETWVTEDIIEEMYQTGAVNSLRLPVGDFMYKPYGPYHGCVDGALEYVDKLLDWCYSRGITVLIDIHALKDSQNGFDNSGQGMGLEWTSAINSDIANIVTFQHWPIRSAEWIGTFDSKTVSYSSINYDNIQHALDVIDIIVDMYQGHPAVLGLEPVNEPWQYTPIKELKRFYWEGYLIVKRKAPFWKYIMHDSFRLDPNIWGGFMAGCPERALDTHIYQAWRAPDSRIGFYQDACNQKGIIATMEREFGPTIVGEWSLATDNCAMWLNGFNDNLPGFPMLPCKYIPCSAPYMGTDQPGTPVDPTKPIQGPFGTGMSGPIYGYCPVGRDWLKESSGNPITGRDWVRAPPDAPPKYDDTLNVMRNLAHKKINAFSGIGHGFYFWNFRTDLYEPKWSYMLALELGMIPKGNLNDEAVISACDREDSSEIRCKANRRAPEENVRNALNYIYGVEDLEDKANETATLTGDALYEAADEAIDDFWQTHRHEGATCDFGGVGILTVKDVVPTDDDEAWTFGDDDEYFGKELNPVFTWLMVVGVALATFVLTLGCFVVTMRRSKTFNKAVREAAVFRPIAKSKSQVLRKSLCLPLDEYEELANVNFNE
ncbi:Probable glucan 1,3-beta-glucosidase A [Seminavis robusta]|uniref:Probable glucan 1,3-beta-glucosidase A n=1 Tax=Seminavis robusta TaxID=568900 RepID=A0A9N8ECD2_9STRA|nr:Probable glucan 1,3-beta-glucosidase A [Seminavis robusta]|eukprot:Sro966_g225720.1 Probable glucan 1,3-beta-glucosidase A (671) ;mRNA; r:24391-26857